MGEDALTDEGWGGACGTSGHKSSSPRPKLGSLLATMTAVSSVVLALGLFGCAFGAALLAGENLPVAGRKLRSGLGGDEERPNGASEELSKRSTGLNEHTCPAPPGLGATLQKDTHAVSERSRLVLVFSLPPLSAHPAARLAANRSSSTPRRFGSICEYAAKRLID